MSGLPPPPPPPPRVSKREFEDEKKTMKHYLKMACEKRDFKSISNLLKQARKKHFDLKDPVIAAGIKLHKVLMKGEVESTRYYLKIGMEGNSYKGLASALELVSNLTKAGVIFNEYQGFEDQIREAREVFQKLEAEKIQYLTHFLKQGLQLNNPGMLDEALKSAYAIGKNRFDKDLIATGKEKLDGLRQVNPTRLDLSVLLGKL
jgi:hypothetical protein